MSVEEYLSNPAFEHHEYVNGEAVPINLGTIQHAIIQANCAYEIKNYLKSHPGDYGGTGPHCRLTIDGQARYRLPDVALIVNDTAPDEKYLNGAPDLAVEIRSPEDSVSFLFPKRADYFANGAKLGWIILPTEQSVLVLSDTGLVGKFTTGDTLEGGEHIPGLSIQVSDLFA